MLLSRDKINKLRTTTNHTQNDYKHIYNGIANGGHQKIVQITSAEYVSGMKNSIVMSMKMVEKKIEKRDRWFSYVRDLLKRY